jgi:hypothetical protein
VLKMRAMRHFMRVVPADVDERSGREMCSCYYGQGPRVTRRIEMRLESGSYIIDEIGCLFGEVDWI